MNTHDSIDSAFGQRFRAAARRVRSRLLARRVIGGVLLGLAAGTAAAALLWYGRQGALRPWSASLSLVGACIGAAYGLRKRWSDGDVALYLDAKLESEEAISTAVELASRHGDEAARRAILTRASSILDEKAERAEPPRVFRKAHALAPVLGVGLAWLSMIPLPKAPAEPNRPTGSELFRISNLKGLEKIEGLDKLTGRDRLQQERLAKIAEDARRLRADLARGIEKREAQARVAKLRDDIAAERLRLSDSQNRPGLEAAIGKFDKAESAQAAKKALANADLTEFDREMQKLANEVEERHRKEAKRALEDAAKAAREKGAKALADALTEQRKLFEEREARAETLRELARALEGKLSEQDRKDLAEFGQSGSPEAGKRLADSLSRALEKLSPEERERLLKNMQKQLEKNQGGMNPLTKEQLEELAKRLASPDADKELERQLRELAKRDPSSEARREQGLDDADRGGAEAERGLGALPIPMPSQGSASSPNGAGQNGNGKNPNGKNAGSGGPGSHRDEGKGDHSGSSDEVAGRELRAKASTPINPRAPMHEATLGRTESTPGETARQKGLGALGSSAPAEIGGVEGSEVPEEYREQVGRYFQP